MMQLLVANSLDSAMTLENIMIVYYGRGKWNRIRYIEINKIVIYNGEDGFRYVIK